MISVVALVRSKPGAAERVRIGLKSLISRTRAETGNIIYVIHESEDPNLFVFYEQWVSPESLQNHMQTPYVTEFIAHCADAFAAAPELHTLTLFPSEAAITS
jgi:quinol monooxygenase YgiN